MRKTLLSAASAAIALTGAAFAEGGLADAPAGSYAVDNTHAYVVFSYDHQGFSAPMLRFTQFDSVITLDGDDLTKSAVETTFPVANIDSGVEVFDGHLKSADWFDADTYEAITFKSSALTVETETTGTITGDLTVKGVTKPVTLDVTFNKLGETRDGKAKLGFSGETVLKRSDYGLGNYVPYVGDDVTVRIEAEYVKAD